MFRSKKQEKRRARAAALQPSATQTATAKRRRGADPVAAASAAHALVNPGTACSDLGDAVKAGELHERVHQQS